MEIWWNSLNNFEQIIAIIATVSTVILIIQTFMSLFAFFDIGGEIDDTDGDIVTDSETDSIANTGLKVFTQRGIIAFFAVFGWSSLLFLRSDFSLIIALIIAILLGTVAMFIVAFLFKLMMKLQSDGNVDINTAVGNIGTVYIPIPPLRKGTGKINATVSGRHLEFDAVTDAEETLKTGEKILIIDINEHNNLIVIKQP